MDAPQISLTGALNDLLQIKGSEVQYIKVASSPSPLDIGVGVTISQPTTADVNRIADNLRTIFNTASGVPFLNALSRSGIAVSRVGDNSSTTTTKPSTFATTVFSTPSSTPRPYLMGVYPVAPPETPSASACMVVEGVDLPIKYAAMLLLQATVCSMIGCNQSTTTFAAVTSYEGPGAMVNFTFYEANPGQRVAAFSAMDVAEACYQANMNGMVGSVTTMQPRISEAPNTAPSSTAGPAADNTIVWVAVGSAVGGVAIVGLGGYMYWRHRRASIAAAKREEAGGMGHEGAYITPKMWRGTRRRLLL